MLTVADIFAQLLPSGIQDVLQRELARGKDPLELLRECQDGMRGIGVKFATGEYYIAELILASHIFSKAAEIVSPALSKNRVLNDQPLGTIVLGTPQGDIHDIGKNIFAVMAEAAGFKVVNLGVDVPVEHFIAAVEEERPFVVGLSALVTTTFPALKAVNDALISAGHRQNLKLIIGGGVLGAATCRFCGADAWTTDAAEGVRICQNYLKQLKTAASEQYA